MPYRKSFVETESRGVLRRMTVNFYVAAINFNRILESHNNAIKQSYELNIIVGDRRWHRSRC